MPAKRKWAVPDVPDDLALPGLSAGGGLAAFFVEGGEVEIEGSRKKRKTLEDVVDEDDDELEEQRRAAEIAQMCTLVAERIRKSFYETFKAGWKKGDEIAAKKGRPKLRRRIQDYVTAAQHALHFMLRKSRMEYTDEDGKKGYEYCRATTLVGYAHVLVKSIQHEFPLEKRHLWAKVLHGEMKTYVEILARSFRLNNEPRRKGCLWAGDVAVLIAESIENTIDGDAGLSYATFLCMMVHAACRPATLIPSKLHDFAITWDDIELVPRRIPGQEESLGWDVFLKLKNFKGYGWAATASTAKVLNLQIRTVSESRNKLLDLGGLLAVLGVRLGIWGEGVTLDDLLRRSTRFKSELDYRNTPVFCALRPRGFGLDENAPMQYESARLRFKELMRSQRALGSDNVIYGLSSIRRAAATTLHGLWGADFARVLIGHNPGSKILEKNYTVEHETADVAGTHTGEGIAVGAEMTRRDNVLLQRATEREHEVLSSLAGSATDTRYLQVLSGYKVHLDYCYLNDSDNWLQLKLFDGYQACDIEKARRIVARSIVNERRALDSQQAKIHKQMEDVRLNLGVTPEAVAANLKELRQKVHHLDERLLQRFALEQVADVMMGGAAQPGDGDAVQEQLDTIELFHDLQADEPIAATTGAEEDTLLPGEISRGTLKEPKSLTSMLVDAFSAKKQLWSVLARMEGAGWESRTKWPCWRCEADPHCPLHLHSVRYTPFDLRKHTLGYHHDEHTEERWTAGCKVESRVWQCRFPGCDGKQYKSARSLKEHTVKNHSPTEDAVLLPPLVYRILADSTTDLVGRNAAKRFKDAEAKIKPTLLQTEIRNGMERGDATRSSSNRLLALVTGRKTSFEMQGLKNMAADLMM